MQPESQVSPVRLIRAASGPNGRTIGDRFVFDEERRRFDLSRDKSLIVYMEWVGRAGDHRITGVWKRPDGSTAYISSDIEVRSNSQRFSAYWTFALDKSMEAGNWQLVASVDGAPAGDYSFEILATPIDPTAAPSSSVHPPTFGQPDAGDSMVEAKVSVRLPTLDQLYEHRKALVRVHRLDSAGRRLGSMSGFVVMPGVVATTFQAMDVSDKVELQFPDGTKLEAKELLAYDALADWTLLRVETGPVDPPPTADSTDTKLGERFVAFNVDAQDTPVIGGVHYAGRKQDGKAERYVFDPPLRDESMGGPLFDPGGNLVGLLSACVGSGVRAGVEVKYVVGEFSSYCAKNTAVPVSAFSAHLSAPSGESITAVSLASLRQAGVITPPLREQPALSYAGTRRLQDAPQQKRIAGRLLRDDRRQFTRADGPVAVYSWWSQPEQVKKQDSIMMSVAVYDNTNKLVKETQSLTVKPPKKAPGEVLVDFSTTDLAPGMYRVDILADMQPVWRTYIAIAD